MSGRRTEPARLVRRAGLGLFLLGLGLFVAALGLGQWQLTADSVPALVHQGRIAEGHAEALARELSVLEGRWYDSLRRFLRDVDAALVAADQRPGEGGGLSDYDREQYRFWLAREATRGGLATRGSVGLLVTVALACVGALLYFVPRLWLELPGIKNDGVMTSGVKSRGAVGIALGLGLIGLYVALYFYPASIVNWIRLADPVSFAMRGGPADRWFFYGFLYTLAILVMGVRMLLQYRHSRYHRIRTASVIFFQLGFAFLIPTILEALNRPAYDFKNAWPLDYSFFFGYRLDSYTSSGALGWFILLWGIALALLLVPLLAVLVGKRWYCSWVCGCGGLAETLGDPFRHLSDKSLRAWRIERWSVHGVLVFAVLMTAVVLVNRFSAGDGTPLLGDLTWRVQSWYGFLIGSIFAGVVGTGFYPLMGNRVWCRFGCPLAAILGIVQRFRSRFRITTNGGQCISCGNCSTYCEMGIDVRWYAQRGQNIVRASCVGCGVCAAVCPRGVLRLENGPEDGRLRDGLDPRQIGSGPLPLA